MINLKAFGRTIVLFPILVSIMMLLLLFIVVAPSQATHLNSLQDRSAKSTDGYKWVTECVDCGKRIYEMTNQNMELDSDGYPHIAYGGDHLYYSWFDGTIWHYETIDDNPGVGGNAALVLDQAGNPHICYHDRINRALKYAYRDIDGWHTMIVDAGPGDTGIYTSIALDQNDLPHITYYDIYNRVLRYAHFDGTDWQIDEIDNLGIFSNLALDSSDTPYVSYHDRDTGFLKYAYLGQTGWITETIDSTVNAASFTSILLDESDYLHIGYYDEISGTLKYAYQDEEGWTILNLGDGLNAGYYLSLKISPSGVPWMSYYDSTNGDLRIGYWQASTWISSTLDSDGNVGGYTSLQFDDMGIAYVAYGELFCLGDFCGAVTLKVAQQSGSEWLIQDVDQCSRAGGFSSLVMDTSGTLHLSYVNQKSSDLRLIYAIRQEDGWLVTDLDGAGELGTIPQPSMVLDSQDKPRFSYTLSTCSTDNGCSAAGLIYAELGPASLITQTVDSGAGVGTHSSLALDDQDYPHISYIDSANQLLKYAMLDAQGWHTETITATVVPTLTTNTSLVLDDEGYPHIAYSHSGLRYAHQDQDGWHVTIVDGAVDVRSSDLAIDSVGNVHIAYHDVVSETLMYAFEDQGIWTTEVISGVQTDGFISMILDTNDIPHIAFHAWPSADLILAHRFNGGWEYELVDDIGDRGKFNSLVLGEDGMFYISYYDAINGDLRHAFQVPLNMLYLPSLYK